MTEKLHEHSPRKIHSQDKLAENQSRRAFLNSAGCAAMGGLVVAAGGGLLAENKANASVPQEAPPLPWKYTKLDPKEAGKRGYKNYLAKGG